MNQKGFASIILVLIVLVFAGAIGYVAFNQKTVMPVLTPTPTSSIAPTPSPSVTKTPTPQVPTPTSKIDTSIWKTYRNEKWRYQFDYPSNWVLAEKLQSASFAAFHFNDSEIFTATALKGITELGPELSVGSIDGGLVAGGFERNGNQYYATTLYEKDKVLAKEEVVNDLHIFIAELSLDTYQLNTGTWKGKVPAVRALILGKNGTNVAIKMIPNDRTIFDKILASFKFLNPSPIVLSDSGIPSLYPAFTWSALSSTTQKAAIYYQNFESEPQKRVDNKTSLAGKEWSTRTNDCNSQQPFQDYYDKELVQKGWIGGGANQLVARGFEIQPISADGPLGSIWGYLRGEGDKIQEIVLSYHINSSDTCDSINFTVFLSDPVKFDSFLPK